MIQHDVEHLVRLRCCSKTAAGMKVLILRFQASYLSEVGPGGFRKQHLKLEPIVSRFVLLTFGSPTRKDCVAGENSLNSLSYRHDAIARTGNSGIASESG